MRIIRNEIDETAADTQALMITWGLHTTCYVKGCDKLANTIIADGPKRTYCLCEEHFQQGNVPGGATLSIVL